MRICIPNQNLPKNTPLGPVSDQVAKFQQLAIVFPAAAQSLRIATFSSIAATADGYHPFTICGIEGSAYNFLLLYRDRKRHISRLNDRENCPFSPGIVYNTRRFVFQIG